MTAALVRDAASAPVLRGLDVAADDLVAMYGSRVAVNHVSLWCMASTITAIIGPSGCGKSTLLRCFNRLHESVPGARVSGRVLVERDDIYAPGIDPIAVRRRIGMVFQRPTPFPTMTLRENVAAGLHAFARNAGDTRDAVERALRRTGLWEEVCDRLDDDALTLSGGQQQRVCIARALVADPRILLLDEPTASLDPFHTQRIEELLYELRGTVTIVIVTHNMHQAARVSDRTAFMLDGRLVEVAGTRTLFTTPTDVRTEAYLTGRFR